MSVSVMEEEDVLELLTGEDEFDADIDEMAEEELLREEGSHSSLTSGIRNESNVLINKSLDDEEEDDDRDSARRGRFRSERIMSLASVPTRRREIPDSLDSINVKLDKTCDKSPYNRKHNNNNQQNYRNFKQNSINSSQNSRQNFRCNKGLLPLPNQSMGQSIGQLPQPQQRMTQNIYGQQMTNNSNPMNTIHVNPHFRARMSNQMEPIPQGLRPPQPIEQMRLSANVMMPSRHHFPNQSMNNSQEMHFNPQMNNQFRPHFMSNNMMFTDQNMVQMGPPLQPSPHPPHLHHQQQQHQQQSPQMQMDNQWRPPSNIQPFQMTPNVGQPQQMMGQQIPMNRQMAPNSMIMGGTQQNFNQNYDPFPSYQTNQALLMTPGNSQPQFQTQNNFGQHFQPIESQRFPIHQNFNKMGFGSQQQNFQSNNQTIVSNNISINQMTHQKPSNAGKRPNPHFEPLVRPYKPLVGTNSNQNSEALKAAQMRTKRAKHLLTKKQQNIVKEVQIVKNTVHSTPMSSQKQNKEIEAAVGVDEEYKKKLEEQKRLREEILRTKEERRKAMAAQRLRETESKSSSPIINSVRSQPQQQIATLLNRSPQPTQATLGTTLGTTVGTSRPMLSKRIVKPLMSDKSIVINRVIVVNNSQKRSVLIKGLAASTTELALRKLCKPIGAIESCKISVLGGHKTAVVTFVQSKDAIQFQSKYSRTLLDLSIIQVSLIWFVSLYLVQISLLNSMSRLREKQFFQCVCKCSHNSQNDLIFI